MAVPIDVTNSEPTEFDIENASFASVNTKRINLDHSISEVSKYKFDTKIHHEKLGRLKELVQEWQKLMMEELELPIWRYKRKAKIIARREEINQQLTNFGAMH